MLARSSKPRAGGAKSWFILFDPDMIFTRDPNSVVNGQAIESNYGPEGMRVGSPYVIPREMAAEFRFTLARTTGLQKPRPNGLSACGRLSEPAGILESFYAGD